MYGFGDMIEKLKANPKTIVLPEGSDPRILEAASKENGPFSGRSSQGYAIYAGCR